MSSRGLPCLVCGLLSLGKVKVMVTEHQKCGTGGHHVDFLRQKDIMWTSADSRLHLSLVSPKLSLVTETAGNTTVQYRDN